MNSKAYEAGLRYVWYVFRLKCSDFCILRSITAKIVASRPPTSVRFVFSDPSIVLGGRAYLNSFSDWLFRHKLQPQTDWRFRKPQNPNKIRSNLLVAMQRFRLQSRFLSFGSQENVFYKDLLLVPIHQEKEMHWTLVVSSIWFIQFRTTVTSLDFVSWHTFLFSPHYDVICTHARKNGIYLLNRQ